MQINQDSPNGVFLANREALELSMRRALQDAMREHKAFGNPIAVWRDGKVILIPPEEIQVDDPLFNDGNSNNANSANGNGSK